jgi:hypothetical protein
MWGQPPRLSGERSEHFVTKPVGGASTQDGESTQGEQAGRVELAFRPASKHHRNQRALQGAEKLQFQDSGRARHSVVPLSVLKMDPPFSA